MRFSIVVPVYKIEDYIEECVNSILAQSYGDFELILVDDGSPDSCGEICDCLQKKDERIVVVHKKNGGASSARNAGMDQARGEYIVFVDGDDLLCEGALESLDKSIANQEPDIIIGNFVHWYSDKETIKVDVKEFIPYKDTDIKELCTRFAEKNSQIPWRPYQCVINNKFLQTYPIRYDVNIAVGEDCDFFLRLIQNVKTYQLIETKLVKYRVFREGSLVSTQSFKSVYSQLEAFSIAFDSASNFKEESIIRRYFADRYTNIIVLVALLPNRDERDKCYEHVRKRMNLLSCTSNTGKYLMAKGLWRIFGFECGNKMLAKLRSLK
ncbi:MAG: glycosyltransferase family 2 protein [Lachnospiraceae bacterium]|nr:glycosyltransferase family 2 protein [Lachnospiraceae bacterium]